MKEIGLEYLQSPTKRHLDEVFSALGLVACALPGFAEEASLTYDLKTIFSAPLDIIKVNMNVNRIMQAEA